MTQAALATQAAAASAELNARLAPQDREAERSVLGGILLSNEMLFEVLDILEPAHFYLSSHRRIFEAMCALAERSEPIDVITLGDELRKRGHLEEVGGPLYLSSLDAAVPATGNLQRYAKIVREKALLRRVIQAAHEVARDGYQQRGEVELFLDQVEARMFAATDRRDGTGFKAAGPLVKTSFATLERLYERQSDITGIPSGLLQLDRMTAGFQRGDLIIVAGRPSMGKTALAIGWATHVAIELKKPVAVFSLEMSADALTTRNLASEAKVDSQRLRTGKLLDSDWAKLARAADRLFHSQLYIDDTPGITALQMRTKVRRLKMEKGDLGLVVVDYLQLMSSAGAESREQAIAEISRGLKALAREMEAPVIALSQLNRSLERRDDKRPMMSDLRESGALEQDADVICFVYRDEVYNKESPDKGIAEIIIGKQRNGPIGTVRAAFLRDYTRFENLGDEDGFGGASA